MIEKLVGQDEGQKNDEEADVDDADAIPQDEDDFCAEVLEKFLIGSEKSNFLDTINIILMQKAIPDKITTFNAKQLKNFNFNIVQETLIAFSNSDQKDAFGYYDEQNNRRVTEIRECILEQKDDLDKV